jgi:hypothetical protein
MTKKFLTSVADVYMYDDANGTLLAVGKTNSNTSIETKLANTDVRGGRGAPLQYVFFHSPDLTLTIEDVQFNLDYLANTVGSTVGTGANVFQEETITLVAKAGTVTGTPIVLPGGTLLYGWVTHLDGTVEKVTFSTKTFTCSLGGNTDTVCVRYYALNSAASTVTINSNILPKIVHLVLETQLNSSDSSTANKIGVTQIDIPKATLSGNFTIAMKADGVASTPITARALASPDLTTAACSSVPVLGTIKEILDSVNWYDNVIGLSIEGGDFAMTHPSTKTLVVYAVPTSGYAFRPPVADLGFTSGTTGKATINAAGLVTTVATGTSLLSVTITSKNTIDASVTLTVS